MNEAKNLTGTESEHEREATPGPRAIPGPDVFAAAEPAVGLEVAPAALAVTAHAVTAHAVEAPPRKGRARGFLNALLILSLVGLFAFGLGVALTLAMLDGKLDLQTGWVKDTLTTLKDLAQHFKK